MRLIDADELITAFPCGESVRTESVRATINHMPTIEVSEDAISREGLLKSFGLSEKTRKYGGDHSGYDTMMLYEIQDYIEDAPSVVPKAKEGEWKITINQDYRCSNCNKITSSYKANYCPYCGAKMKGVENEAENEM